MLYFLYGDDHMKARAKAKELIAAMHKKRPDAELFSISSETWTEGILDELTGGQGLFERKFVVLLDTLCDNKEIKEVVLEKIKELKESENVFVLLERSLDKKSSEKIEKSAEKTQEFTLTVKTLAAQFNMFALAELLGKRDKKNLWVLYQKALREDIAPEEIHGILFWQLKTMLLASTTSSAVEADLKPFVYSKAKAYVKNYDALSLQKLSSKLIEVYHNARRGIGEFETNLERFILEI
jgi:DNA polymerase III delta subunit